MTSRIHRRGFQKRLTLLLGGALLATVGGCSPADESPPASGGPSHGILSITRGDADLTVPADVPEGKRLALTASSFRSRSVRAWPPPS